MKLNLIHLLVGLTHFLLLIGALECNCNPRIPQKDKSTEIREIIERSREKLDLQVKEKLVANNKRLSLKIVNMGPQPVDITQYRLKIQVVDARNAKGEQRKGNLGISSQGKGLRIQGDFRLDSNGVVMSPSAISDNHFTKLKPNVTDEINNLVIHTDWDVIKATIKCILSPLEESDNRNKQIERIIDWELGDKAEPVQKNNIEVFIQDKLNLIYLRYDALLNTYTASLDAIIKNIAESSINLKGISYSYMVTCSGLPSPSTEDFESKEIVGKINNITEDVFLTKGEIYPMVPISIVLKDMTVEQAREFLSTNKFSVKLIIKDLNSNNTLIEKEQQITFTR